MADNPYDRDNPSPASDGGADEPARHEDPALDPQPQDDRSGVTEPLPAERTASPATASETADASGTADAPAVPVYPPSAADDDAVTSTFDVRDRPGQHEAERPVPRSGLAEQRSAGYLTGELTPPERVATPTTEPAAEQDHPRDTEPAPAEDEAPDRDRVVLEGATAVSVKLPSRAGAHVWTTVLTVLLTPVAWYLLADAGARLTRPAGNPWDTAQLNVAALLELAGGLLVLAAVLIAARWSSLGVIITGSLVLILGVPFLAVPAWTQETLGPVTDWLHTLGDFGGNVAVHLVASGSTGRLVVYGLALILIGVVSHGARRQGRREMRTALAA